MNFVSSSVTVTDFAAAQETYHSNGWTDGLPIVPPTPELVSACLEWALLSPEHLVGIEPVRERLITAEKLAINAVMAGCRPEHFPLVVTAFTAMLQPEFLLHGATASTGGCAVLLIVNGPIRRQLEMVTTFNALGNTDRASAAVGRAIRLGLINLLDVRPGEIDRSTLGHPGKFSRNECKNSIWWLNIPPATSNKAVVPTTESNLMINGKALTNKLPTVNKTVCFPELIRINFNPKSSILTINATMP